MKLATVLALLASASILALAACGGDAKSSAAPSAAPSASAAPAASGGW
jgi:hypothetical protein